jgi:Holliday junction resolvase RusA-like endonuclease
MNEYLITPIPKPRMTQRDKWLDPPRKVVRIYREFCRECHLKRIIFPAFFSHIIFILPMPKSWSKKKKQLMDGKAHMDKPDLDNLLKSLSDALYSDDSGIWDVHMTKRWGREGKIIIEEDSNAL